MEKNRSLESVDEQLAALSPEEGWRPDTTRALAQFRESRDRKTRGTRSWMWAGAAAMAVVICLMAFPHLWSSASVRVLKDGQPAPDFNLKDSTGAKLMLSDYKGKAVVLNFWATWCRPCRVEVPMLIEFESRYKAGGLAVIGVSMDDDGWKSVMPYLGKNKLNYPVVIGNPELAKRYGVEAMPTTLLIDREGRLAGVHIGLVEKKTWESEIGRLLER
jgi:cytochrome c biogenesis protein CcmG/thiol:disulfide interchange protein DsbE